MHFLSKTQNLNKISINQGIIVMAIMHLKEEPFNSIKNGTKTIEMRLFDEKRQQLKIGENIKFINDKTGEELLTKIVNLHKFKSFEELYKNFDKIKLGYKEWEVAKSSDMLKYYPQSQQQKYGVVGIEIKLIK